MNRLQVGDEVYVRSDGEIYKCQYAGICAGRGYRIDHVAFPTKEGMEAYFFDISKGSKNKLVYPFPCIKELAK